MAQHTPELMSTDRAHRVLNGNATTEEARLVVAAPALLAALQGFVGWHKEEANLPAQECQYQLDQLAIKARAAIAAAKGERS